MQNRISELQNEEVDYLRYDRIKIQRKRMEHILEVIKDLSFKNKQLFKENAALKQERLQEGHYQKMYHQISAERTILLEKNVEYSEELQRYRKTVFHQEVLINSLKEELYGKNLSAYKERFQNSGIIQQDQIGLVTQQYKILQAQYEDLKKQYSLLYKRSDKYCPHVKKHHRSLKEQRFAQINGKQNEHEQKSQIIRPSVPMNHIQEQSWKQLRQKYDKCKKIRKQLSKQVKFLKQQLGIYQQRQKRHIELIQLLKQKKTKICECHVNKLQKRLSQTTIDVNVHRVSPTH